VTRSSGAPREPGVLRQVRALASIQHLRAVAALTVVTYHALQWRTGGFDVGRAGVDVFFVISGLVMWTSTAERDVTPPGFLWRRLIRVAPLYWIATLATAGAAWTWPEFLPQILPGWRHLALSLAFIPHFDPRGLPFPTLPVGWTLDYEAIFYLAFAGALFAPKAWRARLITGVLATLVAAGFLLDDPLYILGANPMLLQFAAGLWLGVAIERRVLPSRAWGVAMIVLALAGWLVVQTTGWFVEFWRPFQWGIPATLLVGGAVTVETRGGWPSLPPLRRIYLWHPAAIAAVAHLLGYRGGAFVPLAIVAAILAGLASHAWLERPLLAALRRIRAR
jgi:exopolysaccharide production protein ExoZ